MNSREFFAKATDKWPVKVLSVAAALLISVLYKMNTLETRSFTMPLRLESADTLVPASSYPQTVKIGLRGENSRIFPILEDDIEAYIDLSKYSSEDSYRIPIQIRKKGSALGAEPLEITVEPVDIFVRLEKKTSRVIKISPSFHGFLAEGYELTDQSINPSSITVEGPRTNVEALYEFNTVPVDLEGRFMDFSVMVNIINNDPLVNTRGSRMIEYHGTIQHISRESRLDNEAGAR